MQIKETKWMRISSLFVTFSRGANKSNIRFIKNFKRGTSIIVTEVNALIKRYTVIASITNFEQNRRLLSYLTWNVSLHGAIFY